jgi:hypothetical protein
MAGEMLAARFIPGGTTMASKLGRLIGIPAATAMVAGLGSIGDEAAFAADTPYGKISTYGGLSFASQALGSMMKTSPTKAFDATQKLKGLMNGEEIPLSVAEATGIQFGNKAILAGSSAEKALGEAQSKAAMRAFEKISSKEIENSLQTVEEGALAGRQGVRNIRDSYAKSVNGRVQVDWKKLATESGLSE